MSNVDELLPSASDCNKKMALVEAEKASEQMRKQAAVDAEKKALLDKLKGPSGVSDSQTSSAPITGAPSTSRNRVGSRRSQDCPRSCLSFGRNFCNQKDTASSIRSPTGPRENQAISAFH